MLLPILLASDHAGFNYKKISIDFLNNEGYKTKDLGTYDENAIDYPDVMHKVGQNLQTNNFSKAIVFCGTGNGVCMTVNKYPNIRAALCWNEKITALSRQHNDANVICIPARFISQNSLKKIIKIFLETSFENGRHLQRIQKIPII